MAKGYDAIGRIHRANSKNGGLGLSKEATDLLSDAVKTTAKAIVNPIGSAINGVNKLNKNGVKKQDVNKLFKNVDAIKPYKGDGTLNGPKGKYAEIEYYNQQDSKRNLKAAKKSWK